MSWLVESVFSNVQPLPARIERVLSGLKYAFDGPILAGMTMSFHVQSLRDEKTMLHQSDWFSQVWMGVVLCVTYV